MSEAAPRVWVAYLGVAVIWSTTPLAIQWSGREVGYLFGVTARMSIGAVVCLALVRLLGLRLEWHRRARQAYFSVALGVFGAMSLVYWAAQRIPSGWISVLFGLTPLLTGLLAPRLLGEGPLSGWRLVGILFGVAGLVAVFAGGLTLEAGSWKGLVAVLCAVSLHSLSSVLTKRVGYQAHGLVLTTGGLLVALPAYFFVWWLTEARWPDWIPPRAGLSILYLGVVATAGGFSLFYLVLRHLSATRVAMLTLITPVAALWLGWLLNGEPVGWRILLGTALILFGLLVFEFGERMPGTSTGT